ncbi:GNAT family N-acetyltransferase [Streptomyces tateyamensis]|uniref:GNAT family N-acetyltransferase n=1 Tax=Streptomyces tateyamensis TaxID=565073 RepID=A0A2V4PB85_9ACTN|nr:GNAT family N-acetyltransferase [Streptomyces tateyamensis]PYC82151.1 GNAT family N-acetyltransferase [Streptomyces tateyamensis]
MHIQLRVGEPADVEPIAELRAEAMRPDLERLGRYDEDRVRRRFREAYRPEHTRVVEVDGRLAGCVAVRPAEDGHWLEHFYLDPALHGRGIGSSVLAGLLTEADAAGHTLRLNVLQGSPARRLYERSGFVLTGEDPMDVFMVRPPGSGAGSAAAR